MPSRSPAQHRLMAAVAHDPAFAKKVGIPVSVGKDFTAADKGAHKFQVGGLVKLLKAFHGAGRPIDGAYDVAKSSAANIMGKGLNVATEPEYASKIAMNKGALAPTVYPVEIPIERMIELANLYPEASFEALRKMGGRTPLPAGDVTGEQVYLSLKGLPKTLIPDAVRKSGFTGIEYPAQGAGRWFSLPSTEGVKDLSGKQFAEGGPVQHFDKGGQPEREHTKSSGQDASTQPVDSQWRAALRAYLAGTAGLPGDIEGMGRQLLNKSFGLGGVKVDETPVLPTTEFYKEWLPGKQEGSAPLADAASMMGGAGSTAGVRAVGSLGKWAGSGTKALQLADAAGDIGRSYVIRNTGDNNFLKGSVENALAGLKVQDPYHDALAGLQRLRPDQTREELAAFMGVPETAPHPINKFIEGPLTRYVKNQMATPDDPVRALAEQGVLHYTPNAFVPINPPIISVSDARVAAKLPRRGLAQTDEAKRWEALSDMAITPAGTAKQILDDASTPFGSVLGKAWATDNSWLQKVPPGTKVFNTAPEMRDLGFTHLTDELRNALNPESGLPRNLLLTPEKLQNFGMEKAVRHVAAINDWRAAQVAEANAQKANNAATVLHKEYPHTPETPNPKGLRWVELKAPPDKPPVKGEYQDPRFDIPEAEQTRIADRAHAEVRRANPRLNDETDDYMMAVEDRIADLSQQYAIKNKPLVSKELQDALKYEGDTMKHCVGGYCDDVLSGKKRIFSLRDAKGEPHVTIHTEPGVASDSYLKSLPDPDHLTGGDMLVPNSSWSMYDYVHRHRKGNGDFESYANKALAEHGYDTPPERIVQIKRKANLVNSDPYEYRPFVQDFVKSGKWSDVGDMANTGLVRVSDRGNEPFIGAVRDQLGEYVTPEQWDAVMQGKINIPGYKRGGRVSMVHPAAAIQPLVRVPGFDR